MKKITFLLFSMFFFAFSWQSNAQLAIDNTCTTSFDDISSTGVDLALTDDSEANITIPFAFTLDGVSSSNLRVGNNGGVLFNATTGDVVPNIAPTGQGFYPFTTDIDDEDGGVFWETLGTAPNRRVVILWNDRPHYNNSPSGATFEIILYETTNEITFLYQDTDFDLPAEDDALGAWIRVIGANGTYSYSANTALGGVTCINWAVPNCEQAEIGSTKIVNCDATEYSIEVDVTLVGDATEITDGTTAWPISGVGIVTVGPFAFNSSVNLEVTHNNSGCNLSLGDFSLTTCPPSNDDCENAIDLTVNANLDCGVVTSGTTVEATNSGIEPTFTVSGTPDNDVWYSFTALSPYHTISLTNVVAVVGTSVDMGMAIFDGSGSCSLLNLVTSSDPNIFTVNGLTVGATYYVAVYGWGSTNTAQTTFDICVGTPPAPPANDECAGAIPLTTSPDSVCSVVTSGTTQNAFASTSGCTGGKDVWYSFVAAQNGVYIASVTETFDSGSFTSTYISAYEGSCGALTQIGTSCFNTSPLFLTVVSGNTYYINIRSSSDTAYTEFDVCLVLTPPAPVNDDCATATPLNISTDTECSVVTSGTTESATASASGCTGGRDVWYSFVAPQDGVYVASVTETFETPSSTSTYISAYEGSCGTLTQIGTSCTNTAAINITTVAGNTYYVNIRSSSTTGYTEFNVCLYLAPPPPVNDDCAGALVLTESSAGSCDNAVSGTTVSATVSSEADCSSTQNDVWYTFTPSQTSDYSITVTETFDLGSSSTYVSVHEGACGALTQLGTLCSSTGSVFALTTGNTYYVSIRSTSTSSGVNFNLCASPLPVAAPANDLCSTAIALTPGATFGVNPVMGYTTNSTGSGELPLPGCAVYDPADVSGFGGDVWYSVVVPADGNLTIETNGNPTGFSGDSGIAVYSGVCGTLALVECDDDDSPDGAFSQVVIEENDILAGQTVYVRVWEYAGDAPLNFQISAYSATLSNSDLDTENQFTYYPNPVKSTLQLNAQSNIKNVSIFNMLGQEVLRTAPNNVNSTVDMSALQTGAYFVKVTINDRTETIRVVKQ